MCAVLLSVILLSTAALADVPGMISYQGTLTDDGGVALDTTVAITFAIYGDSTGYLTLWSETQPSVAVTDGVFDVLLGSVSPLSKALFGSTASCWLGVQVGSDPEMTPLQRLDTVPFAFHAAEAETAGYALSAPAAADGDWVITGSDMYAGVAGKVGIGVTTPTFRLDVQDAASFIRAKGTSGYAGVIIDKFSVSDFGHVVYRTGGSDRWVAGLTGDDNFRFRYWPTTTEVMYLQATGEVGIGTLAPSTRLDVNGVITATGGNSDQWNAAYGWGDHGLYNYLELNAANSSSIETDLTSSSTGNVLRIYSSTSFATMYLENSYAGNGWGISSGCNSTSAGPSSYGLYGYNYGEGFGVYGKSQYDDGTGVRGINFGAGTFGDLGTTTNGVYGQYDPSQYGYLGSASYGAYGRHAEGNYGTLGGDKYGVYANLVTDNLGDYAIYGYGTDAVGEDGTGYGRYYTLGGVKGYNYYGNPYTFGTAGYTYMDFTRSGGCLGSDYSGSHWGSLGYKSSGGSIYGGYFTTYTTGTGKEEGPALGVGLGAWGDLFGADIHGKVYGAYVEGGSYSLYSHGAVYKDDLSIHLQHTGDDATSVMYTNVSTDVTIQTSGFAALQGGKAEIAFDPDFRRVVSSEVPVVVTVTPTGPCQGVYVSQVTKEGFIVTENGAGKSDVQVAFIAVGRRAGYEDPQLPGEVVRADYVEKLSRGLHNDADMHSDGEGLYFEDGELVVGMHPSTWPDPNKPAEEIEEVQPAQSERPTVSPAELSNDDGHAPRQGRQQLKSR
jgi:hypothetical protein